MQYTSDIKNTIIEYKKEHPGVSYRDISKLFGIPKTTIFGWCAGLVDTSIDTKSKYDHGDTVDNEPDRQKEFDTYGYNRGMLRERLLIVKYLERMEGLVSEMGEEKVLENISKLKEYITVGVHHDPIASWIM